jgi:hypothetical protein
MVIVPETVSVFVPLIAIPDREFIVILAHAAAVSTVTVTALLRVTVSAEVGGLEPPQVAMLLQLPETEATFAAARTGVAVIRQRLIPSIRVNKPTKIFRFGFCKSFVFPPLINLI